MSKSSGARKSRNSPTSLDSTEWPSVTALILNWNGRELLEMCLPALSDQDYPKLEIVLVDNASDDSSVPFTEKGYPQIRIIQNETNLGFSRGMNIGLEQSESDVVVLCNNDIVVRPGWLRELVAPLHDDESIGVAGCKLLYPDERTIQHLGGELAYPLAYTEHLHRGKVDYGLGVAITDVPYVTGAVMAITRSVLDSVGLLDERFSPFYYEEVDYCFRVRDAGFRVIVIPTAVAIHHESASMSKVADAGTYSFERNRLRFVVKHYSAEEFANDFVPAESERLRQPTGARSIPLMQRVYLETAVEVPEILSTPQDEAHITAIQDGLLQLRMNAQAQESINYIPLSYGLPSDELELRQIINEPEFSSDKPVIGPAIAQIRETWNSISTKWYVRDIIRQQNRFNLLVARVLNEHDGLGSSNSWGISLLANELLHLQKQYRSLAEDTGQMLEALQLQLDRVEAKLAALDTTENLLDPRQ